VAQPVIFKSENSTLGDLCADFCHTWPMVRGLYDQSLDPCVWVFHSPWVWCKEQV